MSATLELPPPPFEAQPEAVYDSRTIAGRDGFEASKIVVDGAEE